VLVQGMDRRAIPFMEEVHVCSQDHIAVVRSGGSGHARAVAPKEFLFLLSRPIGEFLGGAALDTQSALRVTTCSSVFLRAIRDGGAFVAFFHPGREMRDIEGTNLAQSGDLVLQGVDGASKQCGQQTRVQVMQFLGEPRTARQGALDIKARRLRRVKNQMRNEFHDEQRMLEHKGGASGRVREMVTETQKEGFEIGGFWVRGTQKKGCSDGTTTKRRASRTDRRRTADREAGGESQPCTR